MDVLASVECKIKKKRMQTKERMRRFRQRLKENEEERRKFLAKDATRKKNERLKERAFLARNSCLIEEKRKRKADSQRRYRQKQKERQNSVKAELGGYKNPQTFGKAVRKAKLALPGSPKRKQAILCKLVKEIRPDLISDTQPKRNFSNIINPETQEKVVQFFSRDDISRQAPGKRDVLSIKNPMSQKREHLQKRHMLITVKEAFAFFQEEFPNIKIKSSKFYELRPKNVLLSSCTPHNVCVCRYHANVGFLLEALGKINAVIPQKVTEFLKLLCCDINNEDCMTNVCAQCNISDSDDLSSAILPLEYYFRSDEYEVSWKQWQDVNGRPQIVTITEATLLALIGSLHSQIKHFKTHCYVKKMQEQYFDFRKNNLTDEEIVLQVDFAENYSLIEQDEIQAAHWAHSQVTIFTSVAWLRGKTISYAIISDDLGHNKYSVWTFLHHIVENLKERYSSINKVHIFSDGCAAQFKNKFTLSNLCYFKNDFDVEGEWNFFATSHGKGAVDAIGGMVKRIVWQCVLTKQANVHCAETFYKCAAQKIKGVCISYISQDKVKRNGDLLDQRWKHLKSIPNIRSRHYFKPHGNHSLATALTSQSELTVFDVLS